MSNLRIYMDLHVWRGNLAADTTDSVSSWWCEDSQFPSSPTPVVITEPFRTGQGHCGTCRKKWGLTDNEMCFCSDIQTMSHIVASCPLTKLDGGLQYLHTADKAAIDWLTSYGTQNHTKHYITYGLQR